MATPKGDMTSMRQSPATRLGDLARLALPLAGSTLLVAASEIADRAFLGHWSEEALAAALSGGMLANVFTGVLAGTVGYASAFVSRFLGADREEKAITAFAQGLWLAIFSLPVFLVAIPIGLTLIDSAGHVETLRLHERTYYLFVLARGAFATFAAALGAWFIGRGQTGCVARATVAGCGINLLTAPLFIFSLDLGVAGAGASAVLASATTCLVLLEPLRRDFLARPMSAGAWLRLQPTEIGRLLRAGLPFGLSSLIGSTTFTAFVLALGRMDASALAVGTACFAVNNFFYTLLAAVETALMIRTGQALGEGNEDDIRRLLRTGLALDLILFGVFFGIVLCFTNATLAPFKGSADATARAMFLERGRPFMALLAVAGVFRAMQSAFTGHLRGKGDTRRIFCAQTIASLFVWMPLVALALSLKLPATALFATFPIQIAVNAALLAARPLTSYSPR